MDRKRIIAFPSKPAKKGGPGSFQQRFETILRENDWEIVYPNDNRKPDVAFVLGGTRNIKWLFKLKFKGIPIIYRLGGINWLYRYKQSSKIKQILHALRLKILIQIQKKFATSLIYQSDFAKEWLLRFKQSAKIRFNTTIYNGVDINVFSPKREQVNERKSVLCVEGNIDYSPYAISLLNQLQERLIEKSEFESLIVYGGFESNDNRRMLNPSIKYQGQLNRDEVPGVYKNAVFLSLDINATCPNTVIEAMASGIPVIGFKTGALEELVINNSGLLTSYGSNPWELGFPDIDSLILDAKEVLSNWDFYSKNARSNAVENFNAKKTVEAYISFLEENINSEN